MLPEDLSHKAQHPRIYSILKTFCGESESRDAFENQTFHNGQHLRSIPSYGNNTSFARSLPLTWEKKLKWELRKDGTSWGQKSHSDCFLMSLYQHGLYTERLSHYQFLNFAPCFSLGFALLVSPNAAHLKYQSLCAALGSPVMGPHWQSYFYLYLLLILTSQIHQIHNQTS